MQRWSNKYLVDTLGDRLLSVAVTPNGYADAVTRSSDGKLYFVEPYYEKMTMRSLLSKLVPSTSNVEDVCYLQSQNGNLYPGSHFTSGDTASDCELANLRGDVPAEIPWCSEALGRCPDAVNLWIGNNRSITSIHSGSIASAYCSTDLP